LGGNVCQALYINTIPVIIDCTNLFPTTIAKSNIFQAVNQKHSISYYFYNIFQCETDKSFFMKTQKQL